MPGLSESFFVVDSAQAIIASTPSVFALQTRVLSSATHFEEIAALSDRYSKVLLSVKEKYEKQILILSDIVETKKKTDWNDFSPSEQKSVQNTTLDADKFDDYPANQNADTTGQGT